MWCLMPLKGVYSIDKTVLFYINFKVCSWFQTKYCWQRGSTTARAGEGIWPDRRKHLPWLNVS